MQKYEIMLMLFPDLGEKATQETLREIKEVISSSGGEIFHEDVWGVRDLAYTIGKQDQAYYTVWNLNLPGEQISELEKVLNIHQAVMRYLITKTAVNHQIKTLNEYELEKEEAEKEAQQKKEEAEKEKTKRPSAPVSKPKAPVRPATHHAPAAKVEMKPMEEKPAKKSEPESVKEPVHKVKPAEAPAAKEAKNLEDVDAKLKSIIDDPDISL